MPRGLQSRNQLHDTTKISEWFQGSLSSPTISELRFFFVLVVSINDFILDTRSHFWDIVRLLLRSGCHEGCHFISHVDSMFRNGFNYAFSVRIYSETAVVAICKYVYIVLCKYCSNTEQTLGVTSTISYGPWRQAGWFY